MEGNELFTPAFETICRLKVDGFDLSENPINPSPWRVDTIAVKSKVALMLLICGEDYAAILGGPVVGKYAPELLRKLRLLGGPHGLTWAALRLSEEGYRLVDGKWVKQDG